MGPTFAKLSVPVEQANRGGLVFVPDGKLQIFRSCEVNWHGARSTVTWKTFRQIAICRAPLHEPAEMPECPVDGGKAVAILSCHHPDGAFV